jgi:hypothetical protein
MVKGDRADPFTGKTPYEAGRTVEQLQCCPSKFSRFVSPGVEKAPTIIESLTPVGFRSPARPLMIELRPGAEIDSWDAIRCKPGPLLDVGLELLSRRANAVCYACKPNVLRIAILEA